MTRSASPGLQRLNVVNDCPCVALRDEEHAIAVLNELVRSGHGGYSVAINAEKIVFYGSRSDVRTLINKASLPYADGAGAVLSLRWLYGRKARKINMPMACIAGAAHHGWRLFVLGAAEEVNRQATAQMLERHPQLRLVGRMNGYESEEAVLRAVIAARPQIVMVALGSPAQELFAARLLQHVPGVFVVGCGGALDILAGRTKRAPRFMVDHGLEWLYRLSREPRRWRRQMVLPYFMGLLAIAACRARLRHPGSIS
jgi:N-acetylglucosaminyldiphosphoundecaprenol N-acetyl-beta-D-mannosaminyltransferase